MDTGIRALSWKEPYATLMLYGKIETRAWSTNYRGTVLICASKTPYYDHQIQNISGAYKPVIYQFLDKIKHDSLLTRGKAIAIGRLVDCRPMLPEDERKCFVKYNPSLFCHIYEDVLRIKPIPFKGAQKWSKVTNAIISEIEYLFDK